MPHSYTKIWIHAIWSTKDRLPLITKGSEKLIFDFIKSQLNELDCNSQIINGMPDHIHCLFSLSNHKSIADVIKQIKGGSSHYINQNNLTIEKFSWQTGYSAFSVSESVFPKVYEYIKKQKLHHQTKTFQQEYEEFIKIYGFDNSNG
jgi:REP element-mobilizing transposase RayT